MSSHTSTARTRFRAGLALVCALVVGDPAFGADPAEDARVAAAESFLGILKGFAEAGDKKKLSDALPKLVKIHNEMRTKGMRGKLQSAAGALMANKKLGAVRMKTADALGRFNDPRGAYGQLKRFMPAASEKASGPFPLRVIQAVGALAPDSAIAPLKQLMSKAKDANVSRYAIQALGKFGWSKKRVQILSDLARFLLKLRPGGGDPRQGRGGGQATRQRYDFLRGTLTAALNELTGQTLQGADEWLTLYKANKKAPHKLFLVER